MKPSERIKQLELLIACEDKWWAPRSGTAILLAAIVRYLDETHERDERDEEPHP